MNLVIIEFFYLTLWNSYKIYSIADKTSYKDDISELRESEERPCLEAQ